MSQGAPWPQTVAQLTLEEAVAGAWCRYWVGGGRASRAEGAVGAGKVGTGGGGVPDW